MSDLTSDPINHPIVGVCERHEIRFDAAACDICRRDAEIERLRAALRFYAELIPDKPPAKHSRGPTDE